MKLRLIAICSLALLVLCACAFAQQPATQGNRGGGMRMQPAEVLKDLNLTAEQTQKIDAIVTKYRTDMRAIFQGTATQDEKMKQIETLRAKTVKDALAVLTPEQKKKAEDQKLMDRVFGGGRGMGAGQFGGGQYDPMAMFANLNLTAAQKTKIQAIVKANQDAMQALRNDSSLTQEARRQKMQTLREDMMTKIKAVLTAEQLKKFEEQMKNAPGAGRAGVGAPGANGARGNRGNRGGNQPAQN